MKKDIWKLLEEIDDEFEPVDKITDVKDLALVPDIDKNIEDAVYHGEITQEIQSWGDEGTQGRVEFHQNVYRERQRAEWYLSKGDDRGAVLTINFTHQGKLYDVEIESVTVSGGECATVDDIEEADIYTDEALNQELDENDGANIGEPGENLSFDASFIWSVMEEETGKLLNSYTRADSSILIYSLSDYFDFAYWENIIEELQEESEEEDELSWIHGF